MDSSARNETAEMLQYKTEQLRPGADLLLLTCGSRVLDASHGKESEMKFHALLLRHTVPAINQHPA